MSSSRRALLGLVLFALACRPEPKQTHAPDPEPPRDPATPATEPAEPGPPATRPRPPATIYRSELRRATHDGQPAYLLRQLAPEPYRPAGRFQGWQITHVYPDDPELCAPCDLRPGDVILSVNGNTLERPEMLMQLVSGLDEMQTLTVHRLRDGHATKVSYTIADAPPPR